MFNHMLKPLNKAHQTHGLSRVLQWQQLPSSIWRVSSTLQSWRNCSTSPTFSHRNSGMSWSKSNPSCKFGIGTRGRNFDLWPSHQRYGHTYGHTYFHYSRTRLFADTETDVQKWQYWKEPTVWRRGPGEIKIWSSLWNCLFFRGGFLMSRSATVGGYWEVGVDSESG